MLKYTGNLNYWNHPAGQQSKELVVAPEKCEFTTSL